MDNIKISKDNFNKAKTYLFENGRPLERAMFIYHFEEPHDPSEIFHELMKFQNVDGGFGNGLESDLRSDKSSALASSIAILKLKKYGVEKTRTEVSALINYFERTLDKEKLRWPITTLETQNSPHAPWWSGNTVERFRGCFANPRATILAGVLHFDPNKAWAQDVLKSTLSYFANNINTLTMHDIICGIDLLEAPLTDNEYNQLSDVLKGAILKNVEKDPLKWTEYVSWPIWFANSPDSFASSILGELIDKNLDFIIESQSQNGSWNIPWSWQGNFPTDWEIAKKEWEGVLILKYLVALQSFGRLSKSLI